MPSAKEGHIFNIEGITYVNNVLTSLSDYQVQYMGNGATLLTEITIRNSGEYTFVIDSLNRVGYCTHRKASRNR